MGDKAIFSIGGFDKGAVMSREPGKGPGAVGEPVRPPHQPHGQMYSRTAGKGAGPTGGDVRGALQHKGNMYSRSVGPGVSDYTDTYKK